MQWQSVAEPHAKDKRERNDCKPPVAIPRVARRLEPSMRSRGDTWRGERRDQRTGSRGPRSASLAGPENQSPLYPASGEGSLNDGYAVRFSRRAGFFGDPANWYGHYFRAQDVLRLL